MRLLFFFAFLILFTGCSTYYQLFELTPTGPRTVVRAQDVMAADGPLEVHLNLWASGGNTDLMLSNISDEYVYVDLTHTHLVVDGRAISYRIYSSQTETNTQGRNKSVSYALGGVRRNYFGGISGSALTFGGGSFSSSSNSQTTEIPEKLVLPPHSYKIVTGFTLMNGPLNYCGSRALRRGIRDSVGVLTENKPFSTMVIRLEYSTTQAGPWKPLAMDLALSRSLVASNSKFFTTKVAVACDNAWDTNIKVPSFYKPNRFYIPDAVR